MFKFFWINVALKSGRVHSLPSSYAMELEMCTWFCAIVKIKWMSEWMIECLKWIKWMSLNPNKWIWDATDNK